VQNFVAAYKKRFGSTPDSNASLGYDSVLVLVDAIRRAGTTERNALREAIATTRDFMAVTGKITIDSERNASKNAVIVQVRNGKFEFVQSMSP
jgi:branched-chain amino acid transport system substrate-binding protein